MKNREAWNAAVHGAAKSWSGMRKKCHGLDSLEADTGTEIGVQDVFRDQKTDVEVLTSSTCEH